MGQQQGKPLNPVSSHPKPSGFLTVGSCAGSGPGSDARSPGLTDAVTRSLLPNLERQGNVAFTV